MDNKELFDEDHAMDMVLNDMVNQLCNVRVRFENESNYIILNGFQKDKFEEIEDYGEDIYGIYKGLDIRINKKDYQTSI